MQKKLNNEKKRALIFFVLGLFIFLPSSASVDDRNLVDTIIVDTNVVDTIDCWAGFQYELIDCDSMLSDHPCPGFNYRFYGFAPENNSRWSWYIDGELFSRDSIAMISFPRSGEYTICLNIITHDGCAAEYCETILIDTLSGCEAAFEYYPIDYYANGSLPFDTLQPGFRYQFYDKSQGDVMKWKWLIDGELFSNKQNPTIDFTHGGKYEICLKIETRSGCESSYCEYVYIDTLSGCEAAFEYYPIDYYANGSLPFDTLQPGFSYQFYDKSQGDVMKWKWLIDGELFSNKQNPTIDFTHGGKYEICLKIETRSGCESSYCEYVYIDTLSGCEAMYEYYPLVDLYGEDSTISIDGDYLYQFEDYSIGNNITYWLWEFGDGETSLEKNPMHNFPGPGEYEVCLTISSELDNCSASYCSMVLVDSMEYCMAKFDYCTYSIADPDSSDYNFSAWEDTIPEDERLLIGFKNLSTPNSSYLSWSFGDGEYSYESNPVHAYKEPGVYEVCLSIHSPNGCYDTYCELIRVGLTDCEVDFTYEIAVPDCDGFQIAHVFKPKFESSTYNVYWSFGDGEYSTQDEPIHIYSDFGVFETCLEVTYGNGCTAKKCERIVSSQDTLDNSFMMKCGTLPVKDRELNRSISVSTIYPIPATTQLSFDINSEYQQEIDIEFTNLLGQKTKVIDAYEIYSGMNKVDIELNELNTGIYIYTIRSKNKILQGQISVIR